LGVAWIQSVEKVLYLLYYHLMDTADPDEKYAALNSDAWEAWALYMLDVIEKTAVDTRNKIVAIRELLEKTLDDARKKLLVRVYSKELIELLFHQPYTKGQFLVDAGIAERQTAAEYLKELEKIGVLKGHKVGKENLYLNVQLYRLLSK
jgi:Fic family protein